MNENGTIRVLLVDDHKSFLWGLNRLIEGERPRMEVVGSASNRADAFALAPATQPDIILLDLDLGDGVRSLDFLPDLLRETQARVLILTGVREREVHDTAIERGARGVVLKDEPAEVILKAIEKVHAGEYWLDRAAAGRAIERSRGGTQKRERAQEHDGLAELTPPSCASSKRSSTSRAAQASRLPIA